MTDFYCEEVLSGKTLVEKVLETENVLAFNHTRPFYEEHIVVIPKKHIDSLVSIQKDEMQIMIEVLNVIKDIAINMNDRFGACTVSTNVGDYQSNKHMHWHIHFGKRIRD
ncbi:HIT family protein [Alkalicoccobacillus gibsonii]|uniref:HIT family protein n=1 Tax=Alkalicoccobacillus gibsonii TaxID=79881 RepID=UPI00193146E2|nr:HIT domain-containing protein [Alkalicoccobacillus gibsonii]MBM0066784.1 HIT domain-containing protein [Alkalicoccobacillus gibsonii]